MLLSRSPLYTHPKVLSPFDVHVLGAPPAFILSQDRTLRSNSRRSRALISCLNRLVRARRRITLIRIRVNRIDVCSCHTSKFRLLFRRRSHRSQYPVLKVRRAARFSRSPSRKEKLYANPRPWWATFRASTFPPQPRPTRGPGWPRSRAGRGRDGPLAPRQQPLPPSRREI